MVAIYFTVNGMTRNPYDSDLSGDILIVDDEVYIAQLIADILADEGYSTRICHDGASALQIIHDESPRLVLLDIGMPIMTGEELLQLLGNPERRGFPVIVMTASPKPQRFLEEGATAVIPKPFDLERLISQVHHLAA